MGLAFKPSVSTLKKTNYISFPFGHTNQVQLGKEPVRWLHFGCLCAGLEASTWPNPLPNDAQKRNCMHHCAATVVGTCKSRKNSSSIPSSNSTRSLTGHCSDWLHWWSWFWFQEIAAGLAAWRFGRPGWCSQEVSCG